MVAPCKSVNYIVRIRNPSHADRGSAREFDLWLPHRIDRPAENGYIGHTQNLLKEKKSNLNNEKLKEDQYVARSLKATNWNVEKAEKMFRLSLEWRSENKLDELFASFSMPDVIEKYLSGGICGQDKFGHPVYIIPAGTIDVFGLMHSVSKRQLALSIYYLLDNFENEVLPAQTRKMDKLINQLVFIFDLQHVNRRLLWRPWLNFFLELVSDFEANYPELMATCFVLNVPSFFNLLFSLIKPLLSKETQAKIQLI
ncbi:hypothetical protein Aperf_G00000030157 [Anoplocephala perfoliata]